MLDAAYEASLRVAALNAEVSGNSEVYSTLWGGGVFGNPTAWIRAAIERAVRLFAHSDLCVTIVSHGRDNPDLRQLFSPPASLGRCIIRRAATPVGPSR